MAAGGYDAVGDDAIVSAVNVVRGAGACEVGADGQGAVGMPVLVTVPGDPVVPMELSRGSRMADIEVERAAAGDGDAGGPREKRVPVAIPDLIGAAAAQFHGRAAADVGDGVDGDSVLGKIQRARLHVKVDVVVVGVPLSVRLPVPLLTMVCWVAEVTIPLRVRESLGSTWKVGVTLTGAMVTPRDVVPEEPLRTRICRCRRSSAPAAPVPSPMLLPTVSATELAFNVPPETVVAPV